MTQLCPQKIPGLAWAWWGCPLKAASVLEGHAGEAGERLLSGSRFPVTSSLLLLRGWAREGLGVPVPTMVLLSASSSPADSACLLH